MARVMTLDQWRAVVAARPPARTVDELREATAFFEPLMNDGSTGEMPRVGRVSQFVVRAAGAGISKLMVEVIEPAASGASPEPGGWPVCVFVHGGGWVSGSVASYRSLTNGLVGASERNGTGVVVVAVEYGLAPEHTADELVDDVMQAVRWVRTHARTFGGDPARVVLVGDSAGAQIAVIATGRIRAEASAAASAGGGALFAVQNTRDVIALVLLYGVLDFEGLASPSLAGILQMRRWYLGAMDADRKARARFDPVANVRGLPRVMVVGAAEDALCSQSDVFVEAARGVGVEVESCVVAGVPHGFLQCGLWPQTLATLDAVARFVANAPR